MVSQFPGRPGVVETGVYEEGRVAEEEPRKDAPPTAAVVRLLLLQRPDQLLLLLGVHGDKVVGVVAAVAPLPPSPRRRHPLTRNRYKSPKAALSVWNVNLIESSGYTSSGLHLREGLVLEKITH